jgi:hypothetical protein
MPAKGILFSPQSESQSLDKEEYGTTYVTEKFVRELVEKVSGGKAFVHRIKKGICKISGFVCCHKSASERFFGVEI